MYFSPSGGCISFLSKKNKKCLTDDNLFSQSRKLSKKVQSKDLEGYSVNFGSLYYGDLLNKTKDASVARCKMYPPEKDD